MQSGSQALYDLDVFFQEDERPQYYRPGSPESRESTTSTSPLVETTTGYQRNTNRRQHWRQEGVLSPPPSMPSIDVQTFPHPSTLVPRRSLAQGTSLTSPTVRQSKYGGSLATRDVQPHFSAVDDQTRGYGGTMNAGTAGASTFAPAKGNAFTNYMARLPSVSYGLRSFRGGARQSDASQAGMSAFQQTPSQAQGSMMSIGGASATSQMGGFSVLASNASQFLHGQLRAVSRRGLSQMSAPSMQSTMSEVNGMSVGPSFGGVLSAVENGLTSVPSGMSQSFGETGLPARNTSSVSPNYSAQRRSAAGSGKRDLTSPRKQTVRTEELFTFSDVEARHKSSATSTSPRLAGSSAAIAQRTRGARAWADDAVTDKVDRREPAFSSKESDDTSDTERPHRASKGREGTWRAMSLSRFNDDQERLKRSLARAGRAAPVVWQRLLRDPTQLQATQKRRGSDDQEEGSDGDDYETDSDPDQWNGLPMKRRSLNNLLAAGPHPPEGSRPAGWRRSVTSSEERDGTTKQTAKIAASPSMTPSLQMEGTAPHFFIDFSPRHAPPSPQPTMRGPKCSSFVPTCTSLADSPYRWAVEDATFVDSPRDRHGRSLFEDE